MEVKMGGIGSGRRWHYDAKDTTENRRKIDIRKWNKKGLLEAATSFSWQWTRDGQKVSAITVHVNNDYLTMDYRCQNSCGEWEAMQYPVQLNWTSCQLGGKRPWFICPVKGCHRRVAILYSGSVYACRHCHQLAYTCQREMNYDRASRQAEKIRQQLGWDPCIFEGEGEKPKGMHWTTFERLSKKQHDYVVNSLMQADIKFGSNFLKEIDY